MSGSANEDWFERLLDSEVTRRRLLGFGSRLVTAATAGSVYSGRIETNWLEVTRHTVPVPDLPDRLDGYTVAHVSDTHFGRRRHVHDECVAALRRVEPDLVLCSGDILEHLWKTEYFEVFLQELESLEARTYAVLGNWEHNMWRSDPDRFAQRYANHGMTLLRNESRRLDDGVVVAGGDDPVTDHFVPAATFSGLPDGPLRLFMVHGPGVLDEGGSDAPAFDLSLAGHTHGGQVRFGPWAPVRPPGSGRFNSGFYDTDYGRAYVSRGVGTTTLELRFMCRPELPIFTFRAEERP